LSLTAALRLCHSLAKMFKIAALAVLVFYAGATVPSSDLKRARTKVPRDQYRAEHPYDMGKALTGHLKLAHSNTKPCHQWTPAELQELQAKLHGLREETHNQIYGETRDNRALRFPNIEEYQAHWKEITQVAESNPFLVEMQRDGHCLEAIMWWVHHLSEKTRAKLDHLVLPTMPLTEWREPIEEEGLAATKVYKAHYNPSSTCLACHGGGMPWQNPDVEPPPLPRQVNGKDRQRRCDEYYTDPPCGPCDGIAGAYYGDLPDHGIYPDCEVVKTPEDVPVAERTSNAFPEVFSVEMRGADRWPRASPSRNKTCNFTTDCSPYSKEAEGMPLPPSVPVHWYAQIHGVLYVDHNAGINGGGRLRHETVYQFPAGEAGAKRALNFQNGERNVHMSTVHIQTPEMAAKGDPGIMLDLQHTNMSQANASGVDDSKLDWRRIPSTDGDCLCIPDPAGLPWFEGAMGNSTYKGRVRFVPPWQQTGSYGPPSGKAIVADHYVKWVFHMFFDIETKKLAMFSSPYGGCSTYGNWSTPDQLWPEWRENPPRGKCSNVASDPTCKPYVPPSEMIV